MTVLSVVTYNLLHIPYRYFQFPTTTSICSPSALQRISSSLSTLYFQPQPSWLELLWGTEHSHVRHRPLATANTTNQKDTSFTKSSCRRPHVSSRFPRRLGRPRPMKIRTFHDDSAVDPLCLDLPNFVSPCRLFRPRFVSSLQPSSPPRETPSLCRPPEQAHPMRLYFFYYFFPRQAP